MPSVVRLSVIIVAVFFLLPVALTILASAWLRRRVPARASRRSFGEVLLACAGVTGTALLAGYVSPLYAALVGVTCAAVVAGKLLTPGREAQRVPPVSAARSRAITPEASSSSASSSLEPWLQERLMPQTPPSPVPKLSLGDELKLPRAFSTASYPADLSPPRSETTQPANSLKATSTQSAEAAGLQAQEPSRRMDGELATVSVRSTTLSQPEIQARLTREFLLANVTAHSRLKKCSDSLPSQRPSSPKAVGKLRRLH